MFEKGKYQGKSVEEIKSDLEGQGYHPVLITEPPNSQLEGHSHPANHILVVTDGQMKVKTSQGEYDMQPGDKITISSRVEHAAYFGPAGCEYFWIEY